MYRIKINYVYLHEHKKTIAKILKYEIILSCSSTHDTVYFLLVS